MPTKDDYEAIGEAIRRLRSDSGLTLREFCTKYEVDPSLFGAVEQGLFKIDRERFVEAIRYWPPRWEE